MRDEIEALLNRQTDSEQRELLARLRARFPIHSLESLWHAPAEMILDAIAESGDLTQRGVKGVIADRAFHRLVIPKLADRGWRSVPIIGDQAYDADLVRGDQRATVQVKMQRRTAGSPAERQASGEPHWVVEVQRTRSGIGGDGQATRPYSFGSFDIIAVNLYASTNDWSRFIYTLERWLLPRAGDAKLIAVMQPVPKARNEHWTDSFEECADWLFSGKAGRVPSFDRGGHRPMTRLL